MKVNRRSALKQLLVLSAGAALLPACVNEPKSASQTFSELPLTTEQEETLAEMAATLIPTTDTPGAKEVGASLFVLRMVNDCYRKEDQQKFCQGLGGFCDGVKAAHKKPYKDCTEADKTALLTKAAAIKDDTDPAGYFFKTFKRLTIQAYTNSEFYLTKVDPYKLVPGKFKASVKV